MIPTTKQVGIRAWAWLSIFWVACCAIGTVQGQAPGMPGGNVGFNAAVAELFKGVPAFSASVDTAMTNKTDKSRVTVPMKMFKSRDRFRIEVDLVQMKGSSIALQGLAGMQNIGMSRMNSLVLPNEKGMLILFPDIKSYTRIPLSEMDLPSAGFKVTKKPSGKDT
ncbi:MAG: hypothetical protein IT580_14845, partial [Verrucomicrobiales bacterium]|nr:hypothetical protein [Verrucomicrobiales bacterium]